MEDGGGRGADHWRRARVLPRSAAVGGTFDGRPDGRTAQRRQARARSTVQAVLGRGRSTEDAGDPRDTGLRSCDDSFVPRASPSPRGSNRHLREVPKRSMKLESWSSRRSSARSCCFRADFSAMACLLASAAACVCCARSCARCWCVRSTLAA